jgi:hypothetical protein
MSQVGGASFLRPRQLLYAAPVVLLASMIFDKEISGSVADPKIVSAQFLSLLVTLLFALVISALTKKHRESKDLSFWSVLAFGSAIGACKFISMQFFFLVLYPSGLFLEPGVPILFHVAFSLLLVTGLDIAEATRVKFQTDRSEYVSRKAAHGFASVKKELIDPRIEYFIARISKADPLENPGELGHLASEIREFSNTDLKGISRQIWRSEDRKIARFTFWNLFKFAISTGPFHPAMTALAYFPLPFLTSLGSLGITGVATKVAANMILLFLIMTAGKSMTQRFGLAGLFFAISILTSGVLLAVVNQLFFSTLLGNDKYESFILMLMWVSVTAIFVALANTALATGSSVSTELSLLKNTKDGEDSKMASLTVTNRDLANFLHSTLQNSLLAAAMKIEARGLRNEMPQEVLVELKSALRWGNSTLDLPVPKSLAEAANAVIDRWRPLLEIEMSLPPDSRNCESPLFAQILEEGISNAVRHGDATGLRISIAITERAVEIKMEDDGFGPRDGLPSLGTSLFQDASDGDWSLLALEHGGSILRVRIGI